MSDLPALDLTPKFIEACYSQSMMYDIKEVEEALNISWGDVDDYWIKWCCLHITMKDGTAHEFEQDPDPEHQDWKRPDETILRNKDYGRLNDPEFD